MLAKLILKPFRVKYKKSYSQGGEDMILNTIFTSKKKGVYVDVGANNPYVQSNTQFFYEQGWKGINIDANPGSMKLFNRIRKRDINLEIGISQKEGVLKYYMFNPSFFNSFDEIAYKRYNDKLIGIKEIKTIPLSNVLDKYLNDNDIDFLTVDVEGFDFEVLKSNDWSKYRPKMIIFESHNSKLNTTVSEIGTYLEGKGYRFFCLSSTNAFYIENGYFHERFGSYLDL